MMNNKMMKQIMTMRWNPDGHIFDFDFCYMIARSYFNYSYDEFWEMSPGEFATQWNLYCKLNGWDKKEEENSERGAISIEDAF